MKICIYRISRNAIAIAIAIVMGSDNTVTLCGTTNDLIMDACDAVTIC